MSTRAALIGATKEPEQDSDKLLDLYWNRAELKKSYAEAQNQQHRLKKRIDEEKGVSERYKQKLEHLESLLIDPEWIFSVAVHYQLRALNNRCKHRLAAFAEQLKQQREKRQHQKLLDTWNSRRSGQAREVESMLGKLRLKAQQCDEQTLDERNHRTEMGFLKRLFKGKECHQRIDALGETRVALDAKERELLGRLEELQGVEPPGQQGLDLAAKRSINFMIMAFAQQLYLLFNDDNLASLVKESGDKSVGAIQYGNKDDCDRILADIKARWNAFDSIMDYADVLQQRARLLSDKALFMQDDDAVPVAATLSTVIAFNESGGVSERNGNLLGENYWDVAKVVSR
ncbi:MAG: hypothetical protein AAF917_04685 [Pseudomonadota bacterium]